MSEKDGKRVLSPAEKAEAGSMAKPSNLPAIPTAAEGTTPKVLTMAAMMRKERFTVHSCREMGKPSRSRVRALSRERRKLLSLKSKGKSCRRRYTTAITRLMAWEAAVARAAPAAPMDRPPTSIRSSTMLLTQATEIKSSGLRESPKPRMMALTAL